MAITIHNNWGASNGGGTYNVSVTTTGGTASGRQRILLWAAYQSDSITPAGGGTVSEIIRRSSSYGDYALGLGIIQSPSADEATYTISGVSYDAAHLHIWEVSGLATSSAMDTYGSNTTGNSTTGNFSPQVSQADCLIIGCGTSNSFEIQAGSTFTSNFRYTNHAVYSRGFGSECKIVASIADYAVDFNGASSSGCLGAAFKMAGIVGVTSSILEHRAYRTF